MRIAETPVFTFDELSEEAQEKALEQFRYAEVEFPGWWHSVYEHWTEKLEELGYRLKTTPTRLYGGGTRQDPDIQFTGFASQGDGASFTAYVDVDAVADRIGMEDDLARLRDLLRDEEDDPDGEYDEDLFGVSIRRNPTSRYAHHMTMQYEVEPWYLSGSETAEGKLAGRLADAILDDARDLAQDLFYALRDEYEYLTSDEVVADSIRANEREFEEDGTLF